MTSSRPADRARWLAPQEALFLAAVILGWAILVISLGKDTSWDFRNYHWYIPYAYLNHRLGFDIAVAHQATFYNPTLDIPFYLLATHAPAWAALGILGAVQGANVVPLYLIARSTLRDGEHKQPLIYILTLLCMTGGLTLGLAGTTYYDNIMSVFTLTGLAIVVTNRETLAKGALVRGMILAAIAGFITGSAVGLKLPQAPYSLGFAGALLVVRGDWKHRCTRLLAGGIAGIAGVALMSGHWWLAMEHLTGNPLFPYFNQYFDSPLALNASYRDLRFIPTTWQHRLLYPLLFTLDWRVADDLAYSDIRVVLAYILGLATIPVLLFTRRKREPLVDPAAAAPIFAFVAVTYVAWIGIFAIYRYILALEMLAPLVVVCAIGLWPLSRYVQLTALGVLGVAAMACTRPGWLERAPVNDPYVQVKVPPIENPNHTLILMAGEAPMGYLVPSLPHQIPVLRIDGWMITPLDGSRLTASTKARVRRYKGDIYLIAEEYEIGRAAEALEDYGLAMRYPACQEIKANLGGPYKFCPVERLTDKKP
ncbi:MAG: hypothetical protein JSR55_16400 [Proteobacteria bacterium]|nr:hypothetical protein [Pseudomonadota bacterium]